MSLVLSIAAPAGAGTVSATMAVSATVDQACSVSAGGLSFGQYDGHRLDGSSTIAATCSSGTSYEIGIDGGAGGSSTADRQLTGSGGNAGHILRYTLFADGGRTRGWGSTSGVDTVAGRGNGTPQAVTVYGRIEAGQSPGSGAYQDLVQVVLSF